MKFYTTMPKALQPFYSTELNKANDALENKAYQESWQHLERAHILAQPYPYQHTAVHWKMILFGIKIKNAKEVIGQIPRLFFGGVKSFVGHIPVGNTGGSNVPPLRVMEIPSDLQFIINENK
jgi:Protein of unknown function (DUF3703)